MAARSRDRMTLFCQCFFNFSWKRDLWYVALYVFKVFARWWHYGVLQ